MSFANTKELLANMWGVEPSEISDEDAIAYLKTPRCSFLNPSPNDIPGIPVYVRTKPKKMSSIQIEGQKEEENPSFQIALTE